MNIKLLTLALIGLLTATVWAMPQEQKIVIKRQAAGSDSIQHKMIFDRDLNLELDDSVNAGVFVIKKPVMREKIARIVIKKSGFLRKNKIIIDFEPLTKTIVKVEDNGKEIEEQKFYKYQKYLEEATEISELEALHPKMEELEFKLQKIQLADTGMMADLEELVVQLEGLRSEHAILKKKQYASILQIIELEKLSEIIQSFYTEAGLTPPQKIKTIEIRGDQFFLNGAEVKGELGQKCIKAYQQHAGSPESVEEGEMRWFDKRKDVQIIFD